MWAEDRRDDDQPHHPVDMPLAVILNLTSFGLAALAMVGLLVAISVMYRPPTRPCHRCGRRVRLAHRVCRHCDYEFEPIRFGR
jgi:hypothetical protein